MRISDWSSDVCSSDLDVGDAGHHAVEQRQRHADRTPALQIGAEVILPAQRNPCDFERRILVRRPFVERADNVAVIAGRLGAIAAERGAQLVRSEEHTSELQSLMRISYAVFCLKKKTTQTRNHIQKQHTTPL